MFHKTWTLAEDSARRVTITVMCYPHHWGIHWRENGARQPTHVLDTTLMIGPWSFNLLVWPIGRLSRVLRRLPAGRQGRGYRMGW